MYTPTYLFQVCSRYSPTLTYLEDRMQHLLELRRAEAVHALQQSGLQRNLRVRVYMQRMLPGGGGQKLRLQLLHYRRHSYR